MTRTKFYIFFCVLLPFINAYLYNLFKEELIPILQLFFEIIEKGMLLDSFYGGDPDRKTKRTLQGISPSKNKNLITKFINTLRKDI